MTTLEPAKFGMTGAGIPSCHMRYDDFFLLEAHAYSIDAPRYIPYGGVIAVELKPGEFYLSTNNSRE